ncbi:FAD-dependent oxidoreductase [bacterium]|nr:FAD-dependent oxidoreductase [bacterium]MDC0278656.1 FAD-dependent oxidoreductase [bacterium]
MRIAVIGSGISGNIAARLLASEHQIDMFESNGYIGGHAKTVQVKAYGQVVSADVAFMVLNRQTYPNFCELLELLGVEIQDSDMSLSVRCKQTGLEYQGSSLNGVFSQRRNLLDWRFHQMLLHILRFNREARAFCEQGDDRKLLGDFLDELGLGAMFREKYLLPMSAAIWSADPECLEKFPAKFILGFFKNHGLLQLRNRPQWLTLKDRSKNYVSELMRPISHRIQVNSRVQEVKRLGTGVEVTVVGEKPKLYDHVVLACHADTALAALSDATEAERELLSCFPYQENHAVLHTDISCLPRRPAAWASWNYHLPEDGTDCVSVTYDLNRLQSLRLPGPLCLTLNPSDKIAAEKVIAEYRFSHPAFTMDSIDAQRQFASVSGVHGVSFCGAYWGYGFHEDGLKSALAVGRQFGLEFDDLFRPVAMENSPDC